MTSNQCAICTKELEMIEGEVDTPSGALVFTCYGNYGSRIFDPFGARYLYIYLCDDCVLERQDMVNHAYVTDQPAVIERTSWNPNSEY